MDGGYLSDNWCKSYGIIEIENVVSVWYSFKLGSVELVPEATWMKKQLDWGQSKRAEKSILG